MAQADPPRNGDLFLGTTPKRAANCPATRRSGDPRQARPLSPLVARAPGSQCFPVRRSHAYDHAPRPPSHLRRILWLCSPGCGVKYAGSSKVYEGGVTGCFSRSFCMLCWQQSTQVWQMETPRGPANNCSTCSFGLSQKEQRKGEKVANLGHIRFGSFRLTPEVFTSGEYVYTGVYTFSDRFDSMKKCFADSFLFSQKVISLRIPWASGHRGHFGRTC